ncbi:MAG: FtsH protease activity modulator HflK [Verrucomicrobia bacterium]|nr:FtsH protease activity modulator HflK [Verrucomicrobiota bacterium]
MSNNSPQKIDFDLKLPNFDPQTLWLPALLIPLVIVAIGLFTAFYTVQAEEAGIVTRFGKLHTITTPGLHGKLPFGIDKVQHVPVLRQMKQEFGFGTSGATNSRQYSGSREEQNNEKHMVTGDLNAALVEWVIQYRIADPEKYLFQVRDADEILRHASEAIMREVVGDRTVDEVITIGRQEIEAQSLIKLQALVDKYSMGLQIDQVQLKNVDPPEPVQASFNEVNNAQQERENLINIANGQYNREVPKARGEAERKVSEAEGYATERINEAEGDAAKFTARYIEYKKAPDITEKRLYLETMNVVIPQLGRKIIIDSEAKQILPLLQLTPGATPVSRPPVTR